MKLHWAQEMTAGIFSSPVGMDRCLREGLSVVNCNQFWVTYLRIHVCVRIWMSLLLWCGVLGLFLFRHTSSDRFLRRCRWVSSSTRTPNNPSKRKRILTSRPPSPQTLFPFPLPTPPPRLTLSFLLPRVCCGLFVLWSFFLFVCSSVRPSVCFVSFSFLSAYSFVYVCLIVCVSFPVLALTQDDLDGSFTKYDIKRLDMYSRNLADYHLITDLLPAGKATWLVSLWLDFFLQWISMAITSSMLFHWSFQFRGCTFWRRWVFLSQLCCALLCRLSCMTSLATLLFLIWSCHPLGVFCSLPGVIGVCTHPLLSLICSLPRPSNLFHLLLFLFSHRTHPCHTVISVTCSRRSA